MGSENDVGPAVAAGASMMGQAIQAGNTSKMNKRQQKYALEQFYRELTAHRDNWAMENAYNHPRQKMQRLKEAGLNPALMYENAAGNLSGGSIGMSSMTPPQLRIPESDIGSAVGAYYDVQGKLATQDAIQQQINLSMQEEKLKRIQGYSMLIGAQGKLTDNAAKELNLGIEQELRDTTIEARKASVQRIQAETSTMLSRNEREIAMNSQNIKESAARIVKMRLEGLGIKANIQEIEARIDNLGMDWHIKNTERERKGIDLKYAKGGIFEQDPWYIRKLGYLTGRTTADILDEIGGAAGMALGGAAAAGVVGGAFKKLKGIVSGKTLKKVDKTKVSIPGKGAYKPNSPAIRDHYKRNFNK